MSLTHRFEIAGHEGYITVGLYEDRQPGELVHHDVEGRQHDRRIDGHGRHADVDRACNTACRWNRLSKKFAYQRFEPSGFTKNPDIRNATSITDYVFRWLACQFIKGYKEATSPNRGQARVAVEGNS